MNSRRRWAYNRGVFWAKDLSEEPPASLSPRMSIRFEEIHNDQVELLAAAMSLPETEPVRRRLRNDRRCFAGWSDGQIAGYGWVSQGAECVGELEREIRMQADEAYIWDCVTLPAFRRLRLYSALLGHILTVLHREGARRVWIGSVMANQPSIHGFVNAGFKPVISLTYVRLFGLCFQWLHGDPSAPSTLVRAARKALVTDHEKLWSAFAIGRISPVLPARCAELDD